MGFREEESKIEPRADGLDETQARLLSEMQFHLEFVDLLGVCSKGENLVAESFCRRVLPLEAVIGVLFDSKKKYALKIKVPYLRYLHGVFFNTEEVAGKSGGEDSTGSIIH